MKNDEKDNDKKNLPISNNRKVPTEIEAPIPKPERKEEDNDFTKGDKNDPLNKKKIDRPSEPAVKEKNDISRENYVQEPLAENRPPDGNTNGVDTPTA